MSVYDLTGKQALVTGGARGSGPAWRRRWPRPAPRSMIGDILEDGGRETRRARCARPGAEAALRRSSTSPMTSSWEAAVDAHGRRSSAASTSCQQRRHRDLRAAARPRRRRAAPDARRQRRRHRARHQARLPGDAAGRRGRAGRRDRQHRLCRRDDRLPGIAGYSATKSAVDRLTRVAAMESGKLGYGVRVNCIYPGLVATEMGVKLAVDVIEIGLFAERRRGGRRGRRPDPARPAGRGRRHGRRGRVPRLRRGALHHRRRPGGRRRNGNVRR